MNIFFFFQLYENACFVILQTVEETQKPVVEQPEVTEITVEEETVTIETQVICSDSYYRLR
jgi:hypothetical protein